ncbi:gastrokine-1 [Dromaius novaehollandiae]|uniref:gastrokine-1 n=1 Tax=Dromaius novaehollandiae TaxID=8790 RepID=UPI00311DBDF3
MKLTVVIVTLGIFLAPALADDGNDDRSSRETLSVNRDYSVADFDPNNGFDSWNSVWDHNTGFGATRVLRKNSCLINKIDRISPSIVLVPPPPPGDEVSAPRPLSPRREYHFIVPRNRVQDLSRFGKSIQALCRGIPAYLTYPASESNVSEGGFRCFKTQMNNAILNYCSRFW